MILRRSSPPVGQNHLRSRRSGPEVSASGGPAGGPGRAEPGRVESGGAEPGGSEPSWAEPGWRGARRLLRGPLRVLVAGQALGQAGDGFAQIAFAQLVVFDIGRGATPARVAGVLAATLLPFTIVGPFAGVLIDRWNRRRLLVVVSWCRAALAVAAAGIAVAGSEPLAYLGVLLLLSSSRFVLAGKGAVLPRTVAPGELVTANAVSAVVGMTAAFLGAVAGSLFVSASVPAGFFAATVGYLAAGAMFHRLPDVGGGVTTTALASRLRQVWVELMDGARVIVRQPDVRRPLVCVWTNRLLLGAGFILLVLVADSRYHLQASGYGLALAATGVAAFVGTLAAPWLARRWRPQDLLPLAFLPPAVAALVAGYSPTLLGLLVTLAVAAVSFQCLKVLADALVGRATADTVRGRVFAAYDVLYNAAFVLAGLAMIPIWQVGQERALLWWLAAAFVAGWLTFAAGRRSWPFNAPAAPVTAGTESRPEGRWRLRWAAAAAGALPVLAFPEPALWWLAWFGLVPWLMLLRRAPTAREAAVRGWLGASAFLFATHYWLLPNLGPFLVLVVTALGVLWAPWGASVWWLLAGRPTVGRLAAAMLVVPAGWVMIETVRSWSSLGGPWGLLGASQWRVPAMLAPAALGGVWLVSYLIVAANTAVVIAIHSASARMRLTAATTATVILAAAPLWYAAESQPTGDRTLQVAIVQPGVIHGPTQRFNLEEEMTTRLPPGRFDLVVWGESSVGFDLDTRPDLTARLEALSQYLGSDVLVNVDARDATGAIRKTSVLVGPQGIVARYEKMRLVPFGEYIPFRRVLEPLTLITRAAAQNRLRGHSLVVMHTDGVAFSPLICFESAFPDMSRRVALDGADLIVFQTATSTFQGSWAPAQHASLAAVRAVETGRPVVHATLTGTSAVFDAQGRRLAWFDTHHRGTAEVSIPFATRVTPYLRYGDWMLAYCVIVLGAAAAVASLARASQSRDPRTGRAGPEASPRPTPGAAPGHR